MEVLATSMEKRTGHSSPDTRFIIWKTDGKRFLRWESLRPMIVDKVQGFSNLPTRKRRRLSTATFQFTPGRGGRNVFFRWIGTSGQIQLNDIIFGRIFLGIAEKYPQGTNKNSPPWKTHYTSIKTKKDLNLGLFWHCEQNFMNYAKEFSKRSNHKLDPPLEEIYRVNQPNWLYLAEGDILLFSYTKQVEDTMNSYLSAKDWEQALLYAQKGYLTENFLVYLQSLKKLYNLIPADDPNGKQTFLDRADLGFLRSG